MEEEGEGNKKRQPRVLAEEEQMTVKEAKRFRREMFH